MPIKMISYADASFEPPPQRHVERIVMTTDPEPADRLQLGRLPSLARPTVGRRGAAGSAQCDAGADQIYE